MEEGPARGRIVFSEVSHVVRHTVIVGLQIVTPHQLHDLVGEELGARAARIIAKPLAEDGHQVVQVALEGRDVPKGLLHILRPDGQAEENEGVQVATLRDQLFRTTDAF